MKPLAYLLVLLLVWTQVDDYWTAALVSSSASLANDDEDEYLPAQRRPEVEERSSRQKPVFVGVKPQVPDFPLARRGISSEQSLRTPFTPPPLYVFMSLQI
jgi:hypothetical protein